MNEFPVVDLSRVDRAGAAEKRELAREVDEICRATGFLAVVNHGVPENAIERAWNATRRFFDLPVEKKLEVKMPYAGYPYGYAPLQAEALAKSLGEETPPDLKETFSIGPLEEKPWTRTIRMRIFDTRETSGRKSLRIFIQHGSLTIAR